ncbi:MarR family winged helix-turn-helix transcriptional regulator [Haploplasma modicum]|uniref:MarR family winged helix-turn-helix transcriptional regulator n=1 Tax=Haploplasma modicum TaxID=2150 RepID=UPI00214B5A0F|nr:MarR family transcriptional regulator [Haploplasma modicum]MCR1808665.1 MarR family transcriptional regulator [Haploplasma modicum]
MAKTKDLINELLVEVFNHILSIEEKELRDRGVTLSMTEIHVLEAINLSDLPTMTNVANRLRVTVGTLTTSIHTLVKKGYVLRTRGVEDKRVVNLKLTDLAKEALVIHDRFHDEMIDSALKDLNLSEDEVLIKSLEGVKEYFKNRY